LNFDNFLPSDERIGVDTRYNWQLPILRPQSRDRKIKNVWYIALPLSSAHRGSHSGGGLVPGIGGQEKYANEGTVYPHASLVEMITYHRRCFPDIDWRYVDMSHESWEEIQREIERNPPDVAAFTVYTATYAWALIFAFQIKLANPASIIIFGNDHASVMREPILTGRYGSQVVDYVGIENNGPFTMMNLIYYLGGQLDFDKIPSISFFDGNEVVSQNAPTFPLNKRLLPDYRLIEDYLTSHYDHAFSHWYKDHYSLKRMVTLPIDGGCTWGANVKRRCKHCAIQGLTPKFASVDDAIKAMEVLVGDMRSNVYAAGDSTLGFSSNQWRGQHSFLDELAEKCANSPILSRDRFMVAYGLITEFLKSAELCSGFLRTWNVGVEAFDAKLLKNDSKGVNHGLDQTLKAFDLARRLGYRLSVSGILGLPGTTAKLLSREIELWIELAQEYSDIITTVSVSLPAVIPGSRMYWECMQNLPAARELHGELLPCRRLSKLFVEASTQVAFEDVEAAIDEVGRGIISLANDQGVPVKFGGYVMGGRDSEESMERMLLNEMENRFARLRAVDDPIGKTCTYAN